MTGIVPNKAIPLNTKLISNSLDDLYLYPYLLGISQADFVMIIFMVFISMVIIGTRSLSVITTFVGCSRVRQVCHLLAVSVSFMILAYPIWVLFLQPIFSFFVNDKDLPAITHLVMIIIGFKLSRNVEMKAEVVPTVRPKTHLDTIFNTTFLPHSVKRRWKML
jgi:hypothetical protein